MQMLFRPGCPVRSNARRRVPVAGPGAVRSGVSSSELQRSAAVEVEDLGAEDELELRLREFRFGLLHPCLGVVEVEEGRAARRGLPLLVGEGDARRRERRSGRAVFDVGGVGVVPRLLDLLAERAFGLDERQPLRACRDLRRADAARVARRLKMGMLIETPTNSLPLRRNCVPKPSSMLL